MGRLACLAAAAALTALPAAAPANGSAQAGAATAPAPSAATAGEGRQLFTSGTTPSCATCHTLRDAGATGAIGPDLDALQPDAQRVRTAVGKGFENMPAFGHVLSKAQIDTLANYVERAARAR